MRYFIILLIWCVFLQAQVNDVQHQLLQQYSPPLRWDNVESEEQTLYSQRVSFFKDKSIHFVNILPFGEMRIFLDSWSILRILSTKKLHNKELEISFSRGGGAYRQADFIPIDNGFLCAPQQSDPCIVKIRRCGNFRHSIRVAIFVSRYQDMQEIAPQRNLHSFCNDNATVRVSWDIHSHNFWHLVPQKPVSFEVKGSKRLELQHYFMYPDFTSQSVQRYQTRVLLNDKLWKIIDYETTRERFRIVRVAEKPQVVSFLKKGYIDIPKGKHQITFDSTAHLLFRIVDHDHKDYLFPQWNEPSPNAQQVRKQNLHKHRLPQFSFFPFAPQPNDDVQLQEEKSRNLALTNLYRQGGLLASVYTQNLAMQHFKDPQLRELSLDFSRFHTFYSNLLPNCKHNNHPFEMCYFYEKQLLSKTQKVRQRIFYEQFVTSQSKSTPGVFFKIPDKDNAYTYTILPSQSDRRLRVIAKSSLQKKRMQRIWLQWDNSPPYFIDIHPFSQELHHDYYMPSQWQSYHNIDHRGNQKKIHMDLPHEIIDGKIVEFNIPQQARQLYIWGKSDCAEIAVQILKSKPYMPSENEYWEYVRRIQMTTDITKVFQSYVMSQQHPFSNADNQSLKFLYNYWKPLRNIFRNTHKRFSQSYENNRWVYPSTPQITHTKAKEIHRQARRCQQQHDWLGALKLWEELLQSGHHREQNIGKIARCDMLLKLGQNYLARRYLYELLVFEQNTTVRHQAIKRLIHLYKIDRNEFAIREIFTLELTHAFSVSAQKRLAQIFMAESDYHLALMLLLALPEEQQPMDKILRCCAKMEWWWTFHKFNRKLPAPQQNYWLGIFYSAKKQMDLAVKSFENSDAAGKKIANAIKQSHYIAEKLRAKDIHTRFHGVKLWEQWLQNDKREYTWQENIACVADFSTTDQIYTKSRDLYTQGFVASPRKPVTLQILGPKKVQLEMRSMVKNYNGEEWILIKHHGQLHTIPLFINENANQNLQFVTQHNRSPYRKVRYELDLPPGLHTIEVHGEFLPLWVQIFFAEPVFSIGHLPAYTQYTLQKICQNQWCNNPQYATEIPEYLIDAHHQVLCLDNGEEHHHSSFRRPFTYMFSPTLNIQPTTQQAFWQQLCHRDKLQLALRFGWKTPIVKYYPHYKDALSTTEKLLAFSYISHRFPQDLLQQLPPVVREASYLNQNLWPQLMALPMEDNAQGSLRRMRILQRRMSLYPQLKIRTQLQAHKIYDKYSFVIQNQAIYLRIMDDFAWEKVQNIYDSHALWQREITGFQPESPNLRLHYYLLPKNNAKNEFTLFGNKQIQVLLENPHNTQVVIRCKKFLLGSLTPKKLTLNYQLNEGVVKKLTLTKHNHLYEFTMAVPKNKHRLTLWIDDPIINQYLLLYFLEKPNSVIKQMPNKTTRNYYVATREKPVKFYIEGPTLLRIDEYNAKSIRHTYREVKFGMREITIYPPPRQHKAMYRIFYAKNKPQQQQAREHLLALYHEPIPDLNDKPLSWKEQVTHKVQLQDKYSLGGQEDGTWTASGAVVRRRVFDDDDGDIDARQYIEFSVTHRYYQPWYDTYFYTSILNRFHEDGGPTLGVEETIYHRLYDIPLSLSLSSSFFMQWPEGDFLTPQGSTEWSLNFSGSLVYSAQVTPKTHHLLGVDVFARYLSLRNDDDFDIEEIDQDVFTDFKADHRWGWTVRDTLVHRPWLDTEWRLGAAVTFNENIATPDRFTTKIEWRQLIANLQVDVSYRHAIFFPDDDRNDFILRDTVAINVLYDHWCQNQNRLQFGANANYDIDSQEISSTIFISFHWGNGRGYYDFSPQQVNFRPLRHQRIYSNTENNHILNFHE